MVKVNSVDLNFYSSGTCSLGACCSCCFYCVTFCKNSHPLLEDAEMEEQRNINPFPYFFSIVK